MTHRSGSGSRELSALADELEQLRADLARGRFAPPPEGVAFQDELAEIQAHLHRIGKRLDPASERPQPQAHLPEQDARQGVGPGEAAHAPSS